VVTPKTDSPRRSDAVRSYFTESSDYWDRVYRARSVKAQVYRRRQSRILEWVDAVASPGSTVVDVGSGAGHLSVALAARGFDVVAIDNSEAMVQRTRENAAIAGVADRVRAIAGDSEDLSLPDDSFDIVVAVGLIPWVERPACAIAEMVRVTKPGGHIMLTLDNAHGAVRFLDPGWHPLPRSIARAVSSTLRRHRTDDQSSWPTSHTWKQVEALLRASDLTLLERGGVGFGPFTLLGRQMMPAPLGRRLDRALQALSEGPISSLRAASLFHMVLAQKPPPTA
jgi:ubiquinone/menaquinone biosynthesis C-methylase UbiE